MHQDDRTALYEKLYFHELERREKISARLALPFAAILATVGLLSFMLNAEGRPFNHPLFWLAFAASSAALFAGAWFFRLAWFGHDDKLLSTADEIEKYHAKLVAIYSPYPEADQLVKKYFGDFLFDYYKRDSSANAVNNDRRAYDIYRANVALTMAILLAFITAIPFYAYRTSPGAIAMTEEKPLPPPPPPPPPPPERSVKGDVPPPPPPPVTQR
jgi:hypothetical protein